MQIKIIEERYVDSQLSLLIRHFYDNFKAFLFFIVLYITSCIFQIRMEEQ